MGATRRLSEDGKFSFRGFYTLSIEDHSRENIRQILKKILKKQKYFQQRIIEDFNELTGKCESLFDRIVDYNRPFGKIDPINHIPIPQGMIVGVYNASVGERRHDFTERLITRPEQLNNLELKAYYDCIIKKYLAAASVLKNEGKNRAWNILYSELERAIMRFSKQ